jgi:type II secretory pathway pseudopilin PulG
MSSKLPAITLLEVVVAMLLSGILIAMAYQGLGRVQESFSSFLSEKQTRESLVQMNEALAHDFRQAKVIVPTGEGIKMTTSQGEVQYVDQDGFLIRKFTGSQPKSKEIQEVIDTLAFAIQSFEPEIKLLVTGTQVITGLQVTSAIGEQGLSYGYTKSYSIQEELEIQLLVSANSDLTPEFYAY